MLASSANILHVFVIILGMSFMKRTKSIGPKAEPCGTPLLTRAHLDTEPTTFTRCLLFDKNDSIKIFPFIPEKSLTRYRIKCFGKVCINYIDTSTFFHDIVHASDQASNWVAQFPLGTNPCCSSANRLLLLLCATIVFLTIGSNTFEMTEVKLRTVIIWNVIAVIIASSHWSGEVNLFMHLSNSI